MSTNNSINNSFPNGLFLSSGGNQLSNYNEAVTWTPSISGSSSSGTGTYTNQLGYYTRIGNFIFCDAKISWTSHTGTGNLLITNLPFNSRNLSGYTPQTIINTINISLLGLANNTIIGSILTPGTNTVNSVLTTSLGLNYPLPMSSSGEIHLTLNYLT